MAIKTKIAVGFVMFITLIMSDLTQLLGNGPVGPYNETKIISSQPTAMDTIPLQDRYGDYINDANSNPFDIYPSELEQTVEYDAESDSYIIYEKIGDEYFRSPTTMTFNEYLDWRAEQQEKQYFNKLAGIGDRYKSASGRTDPMSKIDIEKNLIDRLFGGNGITIETQGTLDLNFGGRYTTNESPYVLENQRTQWYIPDFGMDIQMNVDGKIGDKMDLNFNYDTNASFDFDRKIKLAYDSEQWTEDDIIKKIEAGNVSLPLRSSLIQGAQELFGLKTELQFGRLRLTGILSQQRSEQESIQVQNGATVQEFQLRPEEYDENRHFFISHYHRDVYEEALSNLPYINNSFRVTNIEVWVSDDRANFQSNQTMICGITDMAEPNQDRFTSPDRSAIQIETNPIVIAKTTDSRGNRLPDNSVNNIHAKLVSNSNADVKRVDNTAAVLTNRFGMVPNKDFDIFRGRKLNAGEYFFNPELGFVSLNVKLRPNQVLAVAYEYFYTDNCEDVYKVGNTSDEGSVANTDRSGQVQSEGVIFTKLIKPSSQRVDLPTWDLMMKNVYPLRSNQLDENGFEFDIFYENDVDATPQKFLPINEGRFRFTPLLEMFGLDKLNRNNDPQPDGLFDFVPGVTVIPQNGSLIFPVLEPFGNTISKRIEDELDNLTAEARDSISDLYSFHELYDTSITAASFGLTNNKFVMQGKVKSSSSSEYSLGAWNIPQGSVTVRAGSQQLVEGVDFEVDYGIGRVRIINQSIIQQGVPVNISFEDNSVFSLQQKNIMGLRAEYEVNDNFYIGGTALRLAERPFTEKVNLGDDPIKNKVYGLDMDYNKESMWLTKAVDKLPFYSTNAPSNINFSAEVAVLRPGHNKAINNTASAEGGGVVSIDDFEGAVSGYPLSSQPNRWTLASVPRTDGNSRWPESREQNSLAYGANRAKLAWYVIDRFIEIPDNIKNRNSFTRRIDQEELFNRDLPPQGQISDLLTFDLSYFPSERGPYNYDPPGGFGNLSAGISPDPTDPDKVVLNEPSTRWAGIQRYLNNNDFEAANYEFIEFWVLNPFDSMPSGYPAHLPDEEGYLTFHLGNVSEDVLYDGQQFYENSLPKNGVAVELKETEWGNVPIGTPINDAFPGQNFADQDLGLDGLTNEEEFAKYQDYINALNVPPFILPSDIAADPAADDYRYFNDPEIQNEPELINDLIARYKNSNNPQGNSPDISSQAAFQRGNPVPDKEDLNNNRTLDIGESYHEYRVKIKNDGNNFIDESATTYIRQKKTINSNAGEETWYRFRIPLNDGDRINGITGFRSIQFIRMLINGFETPKTLRLAEFELVRNQWRKLDACCPASVLNLEPGNIRDSLNTVKEKRQVLNVDVVGFQENQNKEPFGYEIPEGIKQERVFSTFSPVFQDENALVMKYDDLELGCEVKIAKLTEIDLRVFDKMQMFVHSEACDTDIGAEDNAISVFIRVGKDFEKHYYEYEIPMKLSDPSEPDANERVWPTDNKFDFALDLFIQAKKLRNATKSKVDSVFTISSALLNDNTSLQAAITEYSSIKAKTDVSTSALDSIYIPEGHKVRIIGNPNLGLVKGISIGVRNNSIDLDETRCGEVWVNELRLSGLQERPGAAGLARLDIQLADLGNMTASTSYSSIGWGALDNKVNERAKEEIIEYDVATNLELGKFFPKNWNLRVPFYAQYAKSITNPEFDAYDLDITRTDEFDLFKNEPEEAQQDVRERSQRVSTIKTYNFTNVRKERSTGKKAPKKPSRGVSKNPLQDEKKDRRKTRKPMPWDISNFSASYAYTKSTYRDHILIADNSTNQILGLDYTYSRRGSGITPFKKLVKAKALKLIKEFNFNPVPNSFTFNSTMNRYEGTRRYRLPVEPLFEFDDDRFDWIRSYDLNWNLTKALKMNFSAQNVSYIDEARQTGISDTPENRPWFAFEKDANGNFEKVNVTDQANSDPNFVDNYWKDNLKSGGRNTDYNHNFSLNYTVPTKLIPYMDWIDLKGQYRSDYAWSAGALIKDFGGFPLAGVIQNSQNRSITANLNFEKLYKKSKYLSNLDRTSRGKTRKRLKGDGDKVTVSKDGQGRTTSRKKTRTPGVAEKLLLRPFFLLRSARLTYKEDFSTILPGFTGTPEYFGLDDSFTNPGLGFVFGFQPDIEPLSADNPTNFLQKAVENNWITESSGLNQELIQSKAQNFEAKFKIEPWKDFRIDVDFKKSYRSTHSEVFKNVTKDTITGFQGLAARDMGSFDMTYYNLNTLFGTNIDELFDVFENNRPVISGRLENFPDVDIHDEDGVNYKQGYGKQSSAVLVPAFIAAYTNQDPNTVELDLESSVKRRTYIPKPNWNLRYDGLTKLPWFKDRFSSFTLEHSYSSRLKVSSFNTDVEFDAGQFDGSPLNPKLRENGNYYTRIEIPAIQISENFNPIIGLKMKTKSEFTLEFEYIKSRDLNLKINTSSQLEEDKKTGFVFGLGYTIKDSNFLKKNKGKKRKGRTSRSKADKDKDNEEKKKRINTGGKVTSDRGSDMTFMLNVQWNDNQFFVHELDTNKLQEDNETRGDKGFQISPSVDYNLNENVTLRAFFDYNTNTPYGSTNFKRTNVAGGITMSLSLN